MILASSSDSLAAAAAATSAGMVPSTSTSHSLNWAAVISKRLHR